jgi:hypothetical protein
MPSSAYFFLASWYAWSGSLGTSSVLTPKKEVSDVPVYSG